MTTCLPAYAATPADRAASDDCGERRLRHHLGGDEPQQFGIARRSEALVLELELFAEAANQVGFAERAGILEEEALLQLLDGEQAEFEEAHLVERSIEPLRQLCTTQANPFARLPPETPDAGQPID